MVRYFAIVIICTYICHPFTINAQEKDSLKKITFQEDTSEYIIQYDTVFINPDTLKVIDTIYEKIQEKTLLRDKPISYFYEINFLPSFSNSLTFHDPKSQGINYNATQPVNLQFIANAGLHFKNYFFKLGLGLSAITEKINKYGFITSTDSIDNADSITYYQKIIEFKTSGTNYFYYSGLSFSFGYNWKFNKISIAPQIDIGYYFKIPTRPITIDTSFNRVAINSNQIAGFLIPIRIQTLIGIEIIHHFRISLGPFFQIHFKEDKVPLTSNKMYGITMALSYSK